MKKTLSIQIRILIFSFCLLAGSLSAQNNGGLAFSHQKRDKTVYIRLGSELVFLLKNDHQKQQGRFESFSDSSIVIDQKSYALSEFEMIGIKKMTVDDENFLTGSAIFAGSLGLSALGFAFRDSPAGNAGYKTGMVMTAISIPVLVFVTVRLILQTKRFKQKKWNFSTVKKVRFRESL